MHTDGTRLTAVPASSSTGPGAPAPEPSPPSTHAHAAAIGRVGQYELLEILGEGGMGTVYRARQDRPRREVALKLVRAGLSSQKLRRRFEHEAEVLGRLQNDGIARIYEAGIDPATLLPFFAMELVHGRRLDVWLSEVRPDAKKRLRLLSEICQAVHYAHTKGVIHRDLKPANILVTVEGRAKILDFGVARLTDTDSALLTRQTETGQVLGTLAYMAPEQAAGQIQEIDTRSDVYALGVIGYELLSGRLPLAVAGKPLATAARVIAEEEPTRLSVANRSFRGDVETIIGKAMAKEKDQRYGSAAALAEDIRHYLNYEPITARPPSTWYNLKKFARRNKAVVGGVAASFLILLAGAVTSTVFAVKAQRQAIVAQERREVAEQRGREAAEATATAQRRALELERVVAFQTSQLGEIDLVGMGEQIRADVLSGAESTLRRGGADEQAVASRLTLLEELLSDVNFTTVAQETLQEHVFDRALAAIEEQFESQPLVQAQLWQTVGKMLQALGLIELAEAPQAKALAAFRRHAGDGHPDTIDSINSMGVLMWRQGRFTEAEGLIREALAQRHAALGEDHPDTLSCMINLAAVLESTGKLAESEGLYRRALDGSQRVLGDEHSQTLDCINNLANVLSSQGRLDEAEPLYHRALEGRRLSLAPDDPRIVGSMNNLAHLLVLKGRFDEAEPLLVEALEQRRRLLGSDHPETLTSINNLGGLLFRQDRLDEAEPYFREAYDRRRATIGERHPSALLAANNLGVLLQRLGRTGEAEPYLRQAFDGRRAVFGDEHPDTRKSATELALFLERVGRLNEAALLRDALKLPPATPPSN